MNKEQNDDIVDKVAETDVVDEAEKSAVNEDNVTRAVDISEVKETANEDIKPQVGTKRERHVKVDKMEVIHKMCEKLSSQQSESDWIFAELEEKRMKLEYNMMKVQQDRQREENEMADRQRREERDFQLRLFGMMYHNPIRQRILTSITGQ